MSEKIEKTLDFVKDIFNSGEYFSKNEEQKNYRFEHTIRVGNIGKIIAEKEGFNVENFVVGCILHDVSYGRENMVGDSWNNHGRISAEIARPFLETLNITKKEIDEICYGIAIHVDGKSDFTGDETAFASSISDADNIDRFDTYRIYDNLVYINFKDMLLYEKIETVNKKLEKLKELKEVEMATETATSMFQEKIDFQIEFFDRLKNQLKMSKDII